jgi:hypothetical protein
LEKQVATLNSLVCVPDDVLFRDLDGEAVILNLRTGTYYGLDEVGTRMWLLLVEHGRVGSAYTALLAEYAVNEDQLSGDLLGLVDKLASRQLLLFDDA